MVEEKLNEGKQPEAETQEVSTPVNEVVEEAASSEAEAPTEAAADEGQEVAAEAASTEEEGPEVEESPLAKGDTEDFKWYVAHALSGQENKVAKALKERVINYKMTHKFSDILVPEEAVTTNVNGKKRTIKKKFFPGYILVKMVMDDESWHLVKNTDKITGFLGGEKSKPTPISDEEASYMTNQAEEGFQRPKSALHLSEGDSVKVIEGPFTSFVGTVEQVTDKGKIKVQVSIFGRPTPVELDSSQVEKV